MNDCFWLFPARQFTTYIIKAAEEDKNRETYGNLIGFWVKNYWRRNLPGRSEAGKIMVCGGRLGQDGPYKPSVTKEAVA